MLHALPDKMTALDAVGSSVFALSGGMLAVRKKFDLFGVLVLSFVVAVTGGIIRDLLIGAAPPTAIASWHSFAIAILGGFLTFYFYPFVPPLYPMLLGASVCIFLGIMAIYRGWRIPVAHWHGDESGSG